VTSVAAPTEAPARKDGPPDRISPTRCVGISLLLLALLALGFVAYLFGFSSLQEGNSQKKLYATLSGEFSQELGPLGPTTVGAPVAVLDIPSVGISKEVVVEGTSPEALTLGPGHLRDTPLPGQIGLSVIYGRRVTFGAPFANIGKLRPGDKIITITQQGKFTYQVVAIGDSQHPVHNSALNQLELLTSSSAEVPAYWLEVDANLVKNPQSGYTQLPDIAPAETAMAGDDSALILTMVWGLALALVAVGGAVAASRWSGWTVYLVLVPAALAILWNFYENLAAILPNLY
jgi:sortase A